MTVLPRRLSGIKGLLTHNMDWRESLAPGLIREEEACQGDAESEAM